MTSVENPDFIPLPPHPFIRELSAQMQPESVVVDLGTGLGRNAFYMAELGHSVIAMDIDAGSLDFVQQMKLNRIGIQPSFVRGTMQKLPFREHSADIVLIDEVLHLMSKRSSNKALADARTMTKPGGLHVVTGYVADASVTNDKNRAQAFAPGELEGSYIAEGWQVIHYEEITLPAGIFRGKEQMRSSAAILAQAPLL